MIHLFHQRPTCARLQMFTVQMVYIYSVWGPTTPAQLAFFTGRGATGSKLHTFFDGRSAPGGARRWVVACTRHRCGRAGEPWKP